MRLFGFEKLKNEATPFINIKDVTRLKTIKSLLKFRFKYLLKEENHSLITKYLDGNSGGKILLSTLLEQQKFFSEHISFSNIDDSEYIEITNAIEFDTQKYINIYSKLKKGAPSILTKEILLEKNEELNSLVAEDLNGLKISRLLNENQKHSLLEKLSACAWLTELLALVLLDLAVVEKSIKGVIRFKLKSKNKHKQLRRIWFGNTLEKISIDAANFAYFSLARQLSNNRDYVIKSSTELNDLYVRALEVIPNKWRVHSVGAAQNLLPYIEDLTLITCHVIARKFVDKTNKPFSTKDARTNNVKATYELIKEYQKSIASEDRLFEPKKDGLVYGAVELVRGLIQQMEFIAEKIIGKNWHLSFERSQKLYLEEYFQNYPHLEVLPFEMNQNDFDSFNYEESERSFDVDLFVRDRVNNKVYAIQLKHMKSMFEAGIRQWLAYLGDYNKKLNKGVRQLSNLKHILATSQKARDYLVNNGICEWEINSLIPVLVHNIGYVDFMCTNDGVLIYDLHSFRKGLTGISASQERYDKETGTYEQDGFQRAIKKGVGIDRPDSIIEEYINEPNFKNLKYFDTGIYVKRYLKVNDIAFESIGLGI